jgi:hypothetical protein
MVQGIAAACQENFKTLFSNEKALMDRTFTADVHIHALHRYLKERDPEFNPEPFIEAELAMRQQEADELKEAQQDEMAAKAAEAADATAEENAAPPKGDDSPLVFGGDYQGEEVEDAVGQNS